MLVLVVEDDVAIRRLVRIGLDREGIDPTEAGTVALAMGALEHTAFDVVILDVSLPDGSGLDVLQHIKATTPTTHIIVLSGAVHEIDRVRALQLGADDYVVKPFYARELTARVLAVQRRRSVHKDDILRFDHLEIDLPAHRLTVDGALVSLTAKEFALLAFLATRPGHVFSRDELLRTVWRSAPEWQTISTVTEHVSRLRAKIEPDPRRPRLLRTVRGAGYRFDPPTPATSPPVHEHPPVEAAALTIRFDGHIVQADAAAAALLGVAHADDLLGRDLLTVVAPQSRAAATERMRSTACGGAPRSQVLVLSHEDGSEVPAEVTTAIEDWHGQPVVRIELRPTPDQTVQFRHLVTGVLSEVTDAVIVTDMQAHIRSWNAAAERVYGWSEPEVLGRHILDIVEWVGHDQALSSAWGRIAETGHWHGEGRQRTRDGITIAVRATISLVRDAAGTAIGIASVNRDIDTDAVGPTSDPDADEIADLRRGIANNELDIHYQPVVDLATQRIITVEALVRWHHPTRGLLRPDAFIAIAERSGLIVDIGTYVLSAACRQIATWRNEGFDISLAVNLSAKEFADPQLVERVTATITAAGLEPTSLWLEVTETALVEDVEQASVLLHRLAALGIGIAIDDFGTGWASLTYLRQFPVHVLKIDRSFVAGLAHDDHSTAIARSILSLGAELGLIVVAEGIETTSQADALRDMGCSIGQGYLYGRPTPADEIDLAHMHHLPRRRPHLETVDSNAIETTPAPAVDRALSLADQLLGSRARVM